MKRREVQTDEFGRMVGISIHDGVICDLSLSNDECSIRIKKNDGNSSELYFLGIIDICLNGLRNNAVISDIYVWSIGGVPADIWGKVDGVWETLWGGFLTTEGAMRQVEILKVSKPGSCVVHVECSYGGAIALICESIEFESA